MHLGYVPVASGYRNGMYKQNGLVKALGAMGFEKQGKNTAFLLSIRWKRTGIIYIPKHISCSRKSGKWQQKKKLP